MKLEHFLTTHTKINSKWVKDINIRSETIKLLEENIGQNTQWYESKQDDPPPRIKERKTTTKENKWDLNKLESF